MIQRLKSAMRDGLPPAWRVPAKYWYARLGHTLEPEMALLPDLVRSGDRAIDVGANFGAYAFALKRLGASVELFEPNPKCLRALDAWAAGSRTIRVHPYALSSGEGSAGLAIPIGADGVEHDAAASIEPCDGDAFRIETVPLRALDSFAFADVALIKIDVEGHEAEVIEGARSTINSARPAVLVEIEQRHSPRPIAETFDRIGALGYDGYFLRGERLVELSAFRIDDHQSQAAFAAGRGHYHNNFLFLGRDRLAAGGYRGLFGR